MALECHTLVIEAILARCKSLEACSSSNWEQSSCHHVSGDVKTWDIISATSHHSVAARVVTGAEVYHPSEPGNILSICQLLAHNPCNLSVNTQLNTLKFISLRAVGKDLHITIAFAASSFVCLIATYCLCISVCTLC